MAERFPRFERQRTGLATPRVDFVSAGQAEARVYQGLSDAIGRMSQFVFERAGESAAAAGAQEGALESTEVLKRSLGQDPALMTIYEKSAYQAATKALSSEVEAKARLQMQEVALQAEREQLTPEDTASRLNDVIDGFSSSFNILSPEIQARLKTTLGSVRDSHYLSQTNEYLKAQDTQRRAEAAYGVADYKRTIERLGRQGVSEDVLNANIDMLRTYMEGSRYLPADIAKEEIDVRNKFHSARLDGAFDDLETLDERRKFLVELQRQQEKGGFLVEGLDDNVIERKISIFASQIKAELNDLQSQGKDFVSDWKRFSDKTISQGHVPDETTTKRFLAQRDKLFEAGVDVSEFDEIFAKTQAAADFNKILNGDSIPELEAKRNGYAAAVRKGGATSEEVDRLNAVEKRLSFMREELKRDPVGAGQFIGRIEDTSLAETLVLKPDEFGDKFGQRISQVKAFNRQNNIKGPYSYLNEDEVTRFTEAFRNGDVELRMRLIGNLAEAAGPQAPEVFAQISEKDETTAHIGGLMVVGSDKSTIRLALDGQRRIDAGDTPQISAEAADKKVVVNDRFAGATALPPGVKNSIVKTANAIYESLDLNRTQFDTEKYEQALQLAAGQRTSNGITYGGIAEFKGRSIIVPNTFTVKGGNASELEDLFKKVIPEDWIKASEIGSLPVAENKQTIGYERLKDNLILQSVGDGLYAIGVSEGGRDQYFDNGKGDIYVIDVQRLKEVFNERVSQ